MEVEAMEMYDCDVCMSAGSVNRWGYCEICGEDFEDPDSLVGWHAGHLAGSQDALGASITVNKSLADLVVVGQDAA